MRTRIHISKIPPSLSAALILLLGSTESTAQNPKICDQENSTFKALTVFEKDMHIPAEKGSKLFLPPSDEHPRGIVLMSHGLNLKPEAMNELAIILQNSGLAVLRVTLPGHIDDLETMKTVSREKWLDSLFVNYCVAQKLATDGAVPLYNLSFSLGALLSVDMAESKGYQGVKFAAAAMLSPAFTPRLLASFVKILYPFPSFIIPSKNAPEFRANEGTSVAAYYALFDSVSATKIQGIKNSNIPTMIFINKDDELVDPISLRDYIKEQNASNWKMIEFGKDANKNEDSIARHLLISSKSLVDSEWNKMLAKILESFGGTAK